MDQIIVIFISFLLTALILLVFTALSNPEKKVTQKKGLLLIAFLLPILLGIISNAYIKDKRNHSGSKKTTVEINVSEPDKKLVSHNLEMNHFVIRCTKQNEDKSLCLEYSVFKIIRE